MVFFLPYSEKLVMNGITPIYRKILSITVHFGKKKELETSNNTQIFMWIGE